MRGSVFGCYCICYFAPASCLVQDLSSKNHQILNVYGVVTTQVELLPRVPVGIRGRTGHYSSKLARFRVHEELQGLI